MTLPSQVASCPFHRGIRDSQNTAHPFWMSHWSILDSSELAAGYGMVNFSLALGQPSFLLAVAHSSDEGGA